MVSSDWNQAGWYLGERVKHALRIHACQKPGVRAKRAIPGPPTEIRTVFFNWRTPTDHLELRMDIKTKDNVKDLNARDFG